MIPKREFMIPKRELYSLEHSQYSEDAGGFAFHIGELNDAIEKNLQDCFYNNRKGNKWQIIYIGTQNNCQELMDLLISKRKEGAKK